MTPRTVARILVASAIVTLLLVLAGYAAGAERPDAYQIAYSEHVRTGRPLILVYGADWCGSCKVVEREYAADLRRTGIYLHLDVGRDSWLIEKYRLPPVGPLPRAYVYEFHRPLRALVGMEAIRGFVIAGRVLTPPPRIGVFVSPASP